MNYKRISLIFIIFALDQLTKLGIQGSSDFPIYILPFLNLVYLWNTGVSFGLFSNLLGSNVVFTLTSTLIIAFLYKAYHNSPSILNKNALIIIVGGGLGNIVDRVRFGGVFDFLDFHISTYHFPAFNLADSFIVIGAALLLFNTYKKSAL